MLYFLDKNESLTNVFRNFIFDPHCGEAPERMICSFKVGPDVLIEPEKVHAAGLGRVRVVTWNLC